MNETFAECYIMDEDRTTAKAVYDACKDESYILDPQLVKKANGHYAVMCGFKNRNTMQMIVGKFEKKFPGKLSWR